MSVLETQGGQRDFFPQPWWPQVTCRFSDPVAEEATPGRRVL